MSHFIPYHGHLPGFWKIHNNLGLSMEFIIQSFTAGEVLLAPDVAEHMILVCQLVSPNSGKDASVAELDSIYTSNAVHSIDCTDTSGSVADYLLVISSWVELVELHLYTAVLIWKTSTTSTNITSPQLCAVNF